MVCTSIATEAFESMPLTVHDSGVPGVGGEWSLCGAALYPTALHRPSGVRLGQGGSLHPVLGRWMRIRVTRKDQGNG